MSAILERVKAKYPSYSGIPDRQLALNIGRKYPAYLSDPEFHAEFERYERGEELREQRVLLGNEPEPTTLNQLPSIGGDVAGQLVRGVADAISGLPEAAGRLAQKLERGFGSPAFGPSGTGEQGEELLTLRIARGIRAGAEKLAGEIDPDVEQDFMLGKVPRGMGSTVGFLAGGLFGKMAKLPGWLTVATLGASSGGVEGFRRAKLAGADDDSAFLAFTSNAAVGTTEAIPLAQMLKRLDRSTGNVFSRALLEGTEEALQEFAQTLSGNAIHEAVTAEDVRLMTGALENGTAGSLTGFFTSLLTSMVSRRLHGVQQANGSEESAIKTEADLEPAPKLDPVDPVTAAAVSSLRPGAEAISLPAELRRENEITLPEPPQRISLPDGAFTVPPGVTFQQLEPKEIHLEASDAMRGVVERVKSAQQRRAELAMPKLESSGQTFSGQEPVPGFLQSAEDRIILREISTEPLAPSEELPAGANLETIQEKLRKRLEQRDLVGAVSLLAQGQTELSRKAVDNLLEVNRPAVPLSAAETLIFHETWSKVLAKKMQGEQVESINVAVVPEIASPSSQALGIMPPGAQILQNFIDRYAPPLAENDPPAVNLNTSSVAPDFQPYGVSQEVANRPHGLGRIRGLGWLLDPRAKANTEVERAMITRAFESTIGNAVAASLGYELGGSVDGAFQVENGRIINAERTSKDAPLHISDFFETLQTNPEAYRLTPEQQKASERALSILAEIQALQKRNGVAPESVDEEAPANAKAYFPRIVTGSRNAVGQVEPLNPRRQGKGMAIGAKQGFQKSRLFRTEAEGATPNPEKEFFGKVYEPSIEKRLITTLARTYRAIADKRLADNPALGGETLSERKQRYLAAFAQDIADGAITEDEVKNIASSLREDEHFVMQPAFAGKVYPSEIGDALNTMYGHSASELRRKVTNFNTFLKGIGFGMDFAAPFLQGQVLMFSDPKTWAKATGSSMLAFLDRGVMKRYVSNPENLTAMRELAQLGVPLGSLQDFMAGLEREGVLSNIPAIGKALERFGASFQTFTEMATVEMWKSYRAVTPKEQWAAVAETIQNTLLRGRMEEIGLPQNRALLERAILLAPAYQRGTLNLVASINESGVSGRIARRALAGWMFGGTLAFTGLMLALGYDWDEIQERLNPWNGDFLTIPVKFDDGRTRNFGLGGSIRSLVRLMGEITESIAKGDGRVNSFSQENPVIRWFRGKLAPVPRIVSDAWLGTDFLGNEVTLHSMLASLAPLASQRLWITRPGEPPLDAGDVLPSVLGLQVWPEPAQRTLNRQRSEEAQKLGHRSYDAAPLRDQVRITRELLKRPEFAKQRPTTWQVRAAFRADADRLKRLHDGLNKDLRTLLENLEIKVASYEPTLHFGKGVDIPLSKKQTERYESLVTESYNEALSKLPWEQLSQLQPSHRQEIVNVVMGNAKKAARGRLIREILNGQPKQ